MSKDNLEQKQHLIDLMNMENKEAMALVEKYKKIEVDWYGCEYSNLFGKTAIDCAKLDLTNRIDMLERLKYKMLEEAIDNYFICLELESLKQQLEYLNNL
jgi:hypothetical protein